MHDSRGPFITPYRKAVRSMLEHPDLTHLDRAFFAWLLFEVDPGTCRTEGVTITGLAELHRTGRDQMKACLERLRAVGVVEFEFKRRTAGWVELASYDQLVKYTPWTNQLRQRAKAQANRVAATRQRRDNASQQGDSPGETATPFLTLINGEQTA